MSVNKAEVLRGPLEPVENKKTSECVFVALVIQHAKRMYLIVESYVACLAIQYFSTLFHKRPYFQKVALIIKCVLWYSLQLSSETFRILRRIQQGTLTDVHVFT